MKDVFPDRGGSAKARCEGNADRAVRTDGPFAAETLSSWRSIGDYRKEFEGGKYVFRGQRQADWKLRTSLERAAEHFPGKLRDPAVAEERLRREFRRRLHHYVRDIPERKDKLEWFALMQHHGAPTRLLDFTYSVYVAVYFAVEHADHDCAVWAINTTWSLDRSKELVPDTEGRDYLTGLIDEQISEDFDKVFMGTPPIPLACAVNPFRLNERLTVQNGVFMCPGDISKGFEANLCTLRGYEKRENVLKLVIPRSLREEAVEDLFRLRITRATLFPGLDGFAQSLGIRPPPAQGDI